MSLLLRDVWVEGSGLCDVRVAEGAVERIGHEPTVADAVVDGDGGALLPGLHDHHIHLHATAAALHSVALDASAVRSREEMVAALAGATPHDGWVRAVGYDDVACGPLDRRLLDHIRADVPMRVQHRTGSLWVLNGAAADEVGLEQCSLKGVERDATGRATGRLWRADDWLRNRVPAVSTDMVGLSTLLASFGVTGVTDATPGMATAPAGIAQRVLALGAPLGKGPQKIVVSDHDLPALPELIETMLAVRPRPVAVHCVTRAALVLTLAALHDIGSVRGDRVEHASVAPPELIAMMHELAVCVVTQPSLVARRGDDYLGRVDPADRPFLWPYKSLSDAGVPVGLSSDAPYGDPDPWTSIRAAADRRAASGRVIGAGERVPAAQALAGFLTSPEAPGGAPRRVAVGTQADLTLLDGPLDEVLADPSAEHVRLTLIGGAVVYERDR